ncbi:Retrovirus-related Pol polyprotein [Arachis hypogaea]|nr:Retrovirus-related Pol polyprotein [Arachis hypogaea]
MSDLASYARVSTQVHDLKQRSTKKVKDREEINLNRKEDSIEMVADNLAGSTIPQKISYKETLLSSPGDAWEGNIVEVAEEEPNPEDRWYIDMEAQEKENKAFDPCPTIPVSKDEFDEWCKSWHAALIVKVLDKRVGLGFLEQRLNRDWAKKGKINVIDIDRDYFLVHFSYEKDYSHALLDGPWMIAGHYLIVQSEVAVHVEGSPKAGNVETPVEEKEGQPEGSITGDLTIQSKCANQGVNCVDQVPPDFGPWMMDISQHNELPPKAPMQSRPPTTVVPQSKPSTSKDPYKEDMEQVIMANMRGMVKQQWEDFNAMRNGNTSHGSNEATRSSGIRHCAHHPDPEDRGKSVIVGPAPEKPPDATLSCVTRTTGSQKNSVNRVSKMDGADASDRV